VNEDKRPVWVRSLLLRVVTYSTLTAGMVAGTAAWAWRHHPFFGTFDFYSMVGFLALFTFLLGYYLFGGALSLTRPNWERSPAARKDAR
jgi:hypothetical protein